MPPRPPHMPHGFDRRGFLGLSGAALIFGIGGPQGTGGAAADVAKVDAAARRLPKPKAVKDPVDGLSFQTPQPQPGGQKREYWVQARPAKWDVAPAHRDEWMNHPVAGKTKFTALVYQRYTEGFAEPVGPASMPGPTFEGEVGDTIVVHFRNGDEKFEQPLTVHPHGVRYNPEYDGAYLGDFTRAGGFVAPGEEFTYVYECTPDSVGVWPYHDHGPNHTLNTLRGLFGAIVVRPKGAKAPDVETVLHFHSLPPQVTGIPRNIMAVNGRWGTGNTPTVRAKV